MQRWQIWLVSLQRRLALPQTSLQLCVLGMLGGLAASILIILFRPFKSGDFIEAGGVIYGSGSGHLGVLIADRGYQAWEEQVAVPMGSTDLSRLADIDAKPIVQGGVLYSIGYNGALVAQELRSGRQIWKREYASFRDMALQGDTLYLVDSEGRIYALDVRSGTEKWSQFGLNKHYLTGPTVYKNYLVVGDNKGNLGMSKNDEKASGNLSLPRMMTA